MTRCNALPPAHRGRLRRCHIRSAWFGPFLTTAPAGENADPRVRFHLRRYLKGTGAVALASYRQVDRVAPL